VLFAVTTTKQTFFDVVKTKKGEETYSAEKRFGVGTRLAHDVAYRLAISNFNPNAQHKNDLICDVINKCARSCNMGKNKCVIKS